ncbi:MBL fold metallo-hydrolase [Aureimonas sp. SA4125]|uniref:MBL fold metallo-hydrolase n=1 Tax=Aureimonas sp. SA4125 TaxID=2826993 RepID=UPI001CC526D8|nr:MBL fold metallo-hydrolase [Aureimonas sp. SA4125]BDA82556.1 MBL fold metallo-hydrolase [Aureimonas sp. SA4125]
MAVDGADGGAFTIKVWGARGTLPGCGEGQTAFGTETCCVEMQIDGHRLIFDAGTGIVALGREMAAEGAGGADLFFSHVHYDHIMGLPFFLPLYKPGCRISVSAGHMLDGRSCADIVTDYMRAPFLPITPKVFSADVDYRSFQPGDGLTPQAGIEIATARLRHPNGAVGYRVSHRGRVAAYVTDTEHEPGETDAAVLGLFEGADIVFYDTTYTDEEMEKYRGYGHSSWQEGVRLAEAAGARQLVLFHHAHYRDDAALARIEAEARAVFPNVVVGRTGLAFRLAEPVDRREDVDGGHD